MVPLCGSATSIILEMALGGKGQKEPEIASMGQRTPFATGANTESIEVYRCQEMLELQPADWEMALQIFEVMGWSPTRPLEVYACPFALVPTCESEAMHQAGEALFAVVEQESVVSACVQMDLGVFYRITKFVAGGAFMVGRKGDYAEGRANGDFRVTPAI